LTEFSLGLPAYREMVASFSTENIGAALGSDPVRVADTDGETNVGKYLLVFFGLLMIVTVILVVRKRAKK
jgi:hypothetical protein